VPRLTGDSAIVTEAKGRLQRAISQVDRAQPDLGTRWQPQADKIRRAIASMTDPIECLHYAQTQITFDTRESDGYTTDRPRIALYDAMVQHEFPQFAGALDGMSENPLSVPESLVDFKGRKVSNVLFWHGRLVLACCAYANRPTRVLEIGTGYGAGPRLWFKNSIVTPESFILVDIPECLFFADVALRQEFGEAVGYLEEDDPGTPILLVPLCRLPKLSRPFDLVLNAGSMQEMTDEWIDYYMAWLDHGPARYFYSINYAAQPLSQMAESRNLWTRPSAQWTARYFNMNMPLVRAFGPRNDFLEAFYERAPSQRSFRDWSVHKGMALTTSTYAEGLDLLRQDISVAAALDLLTRAVEMPVIPKETLWIAQWLEGQGCSEAAPIRERLAKLMGGMNYAAE
jgi:putative sugar O-methyltransferase